MAERVELCGRCAALMGQAQKVRRVGGGADNKVLCQNCGRRRYGGQYEIERDIPIKNKEGEICGDSQ